MKLTAPLNIITRPAQSITTDTIIINSLVDNGQNVVANISLPSDNNPVINRISLTLWDANSTPTYTTIGDWTQKNAEDQIATILGGTVSNY